MGRPSDYTQDIADLICERIADGESLRSICSAEGMPSRMSVFRWLADPARTAFRDQYARAREEQAEFYAESIVEIADEEVTMIKRGKHQPTADGATADAQHLDSIAPPREIRAAFVFLGSSNLEPRHWQVMWVRVPPEA